MENDNLKKLNRHVFAVNDSNGGEALLLNTYLDEIGEIVQQELCLNSYCNSMSVTIGSGSFTPAKLRRLADELEKKQKEIEAVKNYKFNAAHKMTV